MTDILFHCHLKNFLVGGSFISEFTRYNVLKVTTHSFINIEQRVLLNFLYYRLLNFCNFREYFPILIETGITGYAESTAVVLRYNYIL